MQYPPDNNPQQYSQPLNNQPQQPEYPPQQWQEPNIYYPPQQPNTFYPPQQPGQWQQPLMYPPPPPQSMPPFQAPPPQPPRKKRSPWLIIGIIIGALVICSAIGSAINKSSPTSTTTQTTIDATPTDTPVPTATLDTSIPTDTPAPTPKWTTTQNFTGSGDKKTAIFSVPDDWKINWTCKPSSFYGGQYNVIVFVYNSDGSMADEAVNTICKSGNTSDSTEEHSSGDVYFDVISEGDWTLQVQELK